MKTYKPFRDNVLVRKLEAKTSIVLPNKQVGKWIRLEVLAVGLGVENYIKRGMIVIAENMFEPVDLINKDIGFILYQYIHGEEINDGKSTN